MSSNFLTQGIQSVGGMVNGSLDAMAEAKSQEAQARATIQHIKNTDAQIDKMERESTVKVTNGKFETVGQIRI